MPSLAQKTTRAGGEIGFAGLIFSKMEIFLMYITKVITPAPLLYCGGYKCYYLSLTGHFPCG